jgi:Tfp pilus assembly protein PilN
MFWDKWIPRKYLVKSEVCSVEAAFADNGTTFYYTHLKNKNNKLNLVSAASSTDKLELPNGIEKNKIPLVLIVNGKGVVLKKISLSENTEQSFEELIRSNLPAINPDDFFIQLFKQTNNSAFIALCRKEQVKNLIDELNLKKIDIANVLIGAPAVMGLQPLWSSFNTLPTTFQTIELTNNDVDSITIANTENATVKIDDISFNATHTLGFAGGLAYLTMAHIAETNSAELLEVENKHLEKNKFRTIMIGLIGIAFIISVTNVMFYTSYFNTNNKLESELNVYQGKYDQINELLTDYQKKKGLIENAGILNKNKISEYADKIAATIPDEVILSELYFNPQQENDESEDSLITFQNKQLIIKGNCNKSLIINEWANVLKMQKFIKDVSLEKFSYNNEGLLPNFEIKIITE